MDGTPDINERVTLRMPTGAEYDSRVEGRAGQRLTVARPLDVAVEDDPPPGDGLLVCWLVPRGVQVLPCAMAGTRREGRVALWDVEVAGEAWREQRRAFVRAALPGTATVSWLGARRRDLVRATVVDVSEGGLRCRTESPTLERAEPGIPVDVALEVAGRRFDLAAQVVRVHPPDTRTGGQWECVLAFVDAGRTGDELRKLVFEQQLRERNGG